MNRAFPQSRNDPSDPLSRQIGEALRFLNRLVALPPAERAAIRIPEDPVVYAEMARRILATVEQAYGMGASPEPRLSVGAAEFAERVDRQLDAYGMTGNLWDLARLAVRAILVWHLPHLEAVARTVYAPFECAIPSASLRSKI